MGQKPLTAISKNPWDNAEEDYLLSLSLAALSIPFRREIVKLAPVVQRIILGMIAGTEGVMAWLGYPTPAG